MRRTTKLYSDNGRQSNIARHQAMTLRGVAQTLRRLQSPSLGYKVQACRLEQIAREIESIAGPSGRSNCGQRATPAVR